MLWISMKHIDVTNPWWEVDCGSSSLPFRNVWIPWEVLAAGVHASLAKELQSLSSSTCVGWFVWKCGFWMFLGDLFKGVSLSFIFIWNLEQLEQPYFWRYLQLTVYIFRHIWILLNFAVGLQYVLQSFLHSPACARSWREVVQTSPQLHLTYVKGSACEKDGWWPSLTIDHRPWLTQMWRSESSGQMPWTIFAFGKACPVLPSRSGKKRPKDTPRRFYLGTHQYMLQQCRFLCTMGGSQG